MFGLGPIGRWLAHGEPVSDPATGMNLLATDVAELSEIARTVTAEYGVSSPAVISANLTRLLARRVPVTSLTAGGAPGFANLNFADGTVILVHSSNTGELGLLAVGALQRRVRLDGFACTADGVRATLGRAGREVAVQALGVTPGR